MSEELSPEIQDVMRKVQKLLNLAAKAGTEAEAAAASSKANELLTKYNLDAATVEKEGGKDGKREEMKVDGGFYAFQRELWQSVAQLNFCLYWTQMYRATATRYVDKYTGAKSMKRTDNNERRKVDVLKYRHALVGRIVNTRTTVVMTQYLQQAIERVLEDRIHGNNEQAQIDKQSNWAHSFRRGVAASVIERVEDRRRQRINEERAEARKAAKAMEGQGSTSTALTLSTYIDAETDANNDFIHGEGWSAEQAREEREAAERRRIRLEEYTRWAEANPEEARKQAEEREKEARKTRWRGGRTERDNTDYSAYSSGRSAGKSISIDQQTDHKTAKHGRIVGPKAMHL